MPSLTTEDQATLQHYDRLCSVCKVHAWKGYCRQCDDFYYECDCDPTDHHFHRRYPHAPLHSMDDFMDDAVVCLERNYHKPYRPEDVWTSVYSAARYYCGLGSHEPGVPASLAEFMTRYLAAQSARTEPIRREWVRMNLDAFRGLAVGQYVATPVMGVVVQLVHPRGLTVIAELPHYNGSRTQIINDRVLVSLGYTISRCENVLQSPKEFLATLARISYDPSVLAGGAWVNQWEEDIKRANKLKART